MVPRTINLFKTLPSCDRLDRLWAVYMLVLEKNGHKSKIYIGSGTHAGQGGWARMISRSVIFMNRRLQMSRNIPFLPEWVGHAKLLNSLAGAGGSFSTRYEGRWPRHHIHSCAKRSLFGLIFRPSHVDMAPSSCSRDNSAAVEITHGRRRQKLPVADRFLLLQRLATALLLRPSSTAILRLTRHCTYSS